MKRIGLIGFGCVGQGTYELLGNLNTPMFAVTKVIVKTPGKSRMVDPKLISYDVNDVLDNTAIDFLIEATNDTDFAYDLAKKALSRGIPLISANKKMIANHLEELTRLAAEFDTPFRYEAAACGAIPIVETLNNYFRQVPVFEIKGIFNGTSNYILTQIFQNKLDYNSALEKAQELGFAETDPTSDVGGYDAKYKLAILANHAFGITLNPNSILNLGIDSLKPIDINFFVKRNQKIKLIAKSYWHGDRIVSYVLPHFVNDVDPLFSIELEYNSVWVETGTAGSQIFTGKGAGSSPTATAILGDLQHLAERRAYKAKPTKNEIRSCNSDEPKIEIYARLNNPEDLKNFQFNQIIEKHEADGSIQVVGVIKLSILSEIRSWVLENHIPLVASNQKVSGGDNLDSKVNDLNSLTKISA
jgi:homoserine dehydrogenase